MTLPSTDPYLPLMYKNILRLLTPPPLPATITSTIELTTYFIIRVYGQFSIETIHERRKRNWEFSGLMSEYLPLRSVYRMGSSMSMIAV